MRNLHLAIALALFATACEHDVTLHPEPGTPTTVNRRVSTNNELDVLFVIDNSASTADKQNRFLSELPALVTALAAGTAGMPSLHIGVVSTTVDIGVSGFSQGAEGCPHPDTADDGLLQNTARIAGCTPPSDRYIEDVTNPDGSHGGNYTGTLADTLTCIGALGDTGCGFEAPLEAMRRALDGSRPENAGFLRPEAALAVIILTDEDDCSVADSSLFELGSAAGGPGDFRCQPLASYTCDQPISVTDPGTYTNCTPTLGGYLYDPSAYVDFLATIKDPSQTTVAVIAGDPSSTISTGPIPALMQTLALEPSCTLTVDGAAEYGRPGIRLTAFETGFEGRGVYQSVCQADYTSALTAMGQTTLAMMGSCLDVAISTVDADPTNPGLQPACVVTERVNLDTTFEEDTVLPACAMTDTNTPSGTGARPCWWLEQGSTTCAAEPNDLLLHVDVTAALPTGAIIDATCPTP